METVEISGVEPPNESNADAEELGIIEIFKRGLHPPIEAQGIHARAALQQITSQSFLKEDRDKLSVVRRELETPLSEIQNSARQLIIELNQETLLREAKKDYTHHFTGEQRHPRLKFLIFLRIHLLLASFSRLTTEQWKKVNRHLGDALSASHLRREIQTTQVGPALWNCEVTNVFAKRMARILQAKEDLNGARNISKLITYREDIDYQISLVFHEKLSDLLKSPTYLNTIQPSIGRKTNQNTSEDDSKHKAALQSLSVHLNGGGNSEWNSGFPYQFAFDRVRLLSEKSLFTSVIHIEGHLGIEDSRKRSTIILSYSKPIQNAEAKYGQFIVSVLGMLLELLVLQFKLTEKQKYLFLFHLGPQMFYFFTRRFLEKLQTGYLHRRPHGSTKIERCLPIEHIKQSIAGWWRSEVLTQIQNEKDDPQLFLQLIAHVRSNIREEPRQGELTTFIDKIVGQRFLREGFIKMK